MNAVAEALDFMKQLGTPSSLLDDAREIVPRPLRVNSHVHLPPNFSAFQSVSQAVELAAAERLDVLGASNYYDYDVYGPFARLARSHGIFPLFGLEVIALIDDLVKSGVKINDPGNPGKIYVCGKGITRLAPLCAEAMEILEVIRRNDSSRIREMIARLEQTLASRGTPTGITEDRVIDLVVQRHGCPREQVWLQERHVCLAFQEELFRLLPARGRADAIARLLGLGKPSFSDDDAVRIQNEIRSQLLKSGKPAFVPETFISFEQARKMILAFGGVPCYPVLADGTNPITPFESPVEKLIEHLRRLGFHAVEFIPVRNTPDVLSRYVKAFHDAGFVVTAGTEHNTLDLIPLLPSCVGGVPVPDDVVAIFNRGARIVAAHQFLSLHNQPGFVDADGRRNPNLELESLERLGGAVIDRYRKQAMN
jgi:hypothetical protein